MATATKKQILEEKEKLMQMAIDQSRYAVDSNRGGPFGAIVVKNGKVVGSAGNSVMANTDPTAHAEVMAIRDACKNLKSTDLSGCEIYCSGEPCPMCTAAIYWSQISEVYYSNSEEEALEYGFIDKKILAEIKKPKAKRKMKFEKIKNSEAIAVFDRYLKRLA